MDALEGPSKISDSRQVALPKRLMDSLGWDKGDYVMFRLSDDDPEVMKVVLESVVLRQLRRGEDAERTMREQRAETTTDESPQDRG
ncbi:AbrB/MazE/SpoVT family DNA-binding domain-containing protein [Mycobacterium sp. UM_CSW]|uniref:AbrB/MazE/SpoVT family DNA-binding domain-containing protein n=1 Tax=Mycobacterium sp. UM_CSW TaxID=1370119 RepID=UPI00041A9E9C|nr:AbrB/MazE/SpoVT family DNA-binding domain-containing protein [Mycobacterium sp. UM_CSW]